MESSESHMNPKTLGAEMQKLRHSMGMSVVRFAGELNKPAWLVDLIEHAGEANASTLCDLLPSREIASVQEAFMRLGSMPRFGNAAPGRQRVAPPAELTFYLPMTLSADSLTDIMDQVLLLAAAAGEPEANHQRLLRQSVVSVSSLACLLHTQYMHTGDQRNADRCLRRFRESLQERMQLLR